jgi:hypothetical protein
MSLASALAIAGIVLAFAIFAATLARRRSDYLVASHRRRTFNQDALASTGGSSDWEMIMPDLASIHAK